MKTNIVDIDLPKLKINYPFIKKWKVYINFIHKYVLHSVNLYIFISENFKNAEEYKEETKDDKSSHHLSLFVNWQVYLFYLAYHQHFSMPLHILLKYDLNNYLYIPGDEAELH